MFNVRRAALITPKNFAMSHKLRTFAAMKTEKRRMPAEWEPQRGVQLTWPHARTDWASILPDITAVYERIAREIARRERLFIVAPEGTPLPAGCERSLTADTNDTWARDHGFITVVDESAHTTTQQSRTSTRLLDFRFNGWGEKFPAELDNQINRKLYDSGVVKGVYEPHLDFVLEGGSIESDGQGTILTTERCLMAPHRNQPLTKQEIEERLKEYLGAERVVWLRHGSLLGDDTDGHIDTLARLCPNDTILYTDGDDSQPDLYEMEQELRELRTLDGRPYRLLKLPLPRPIYDDGRAQSGAPSESSDRLPATYANYLVINGAVLVPTYGQPDLDAEATRVISEAYPDRETVGIDCLPVIRQHGSLHCCTMQYYET